MNQIDNSSPNPSASDAPEWFLPQIVGLALVAVSYLLTVRAGLLLVTHPEDIAAVWPVSGLALAILLLSPKRQWTMLLAVIFITNAAGNWSGGNSLPVSLGFALVNALEPLLAAWLLTYFCGSRITFGRTREVFALFGVAIFSNGITALLGAAVPAFALEAPYWMTWFLWWTADGLGMILIAPLIVTWSTSQNSLRFTSLRQAVEAVLLILTLVVFSWSLFGPFTHAENPILQSYMFFPILIWLAFRYAPRGMSGALTLLSLIAVWNTLRNGGVFSFEMQTTTRHLESVQLFLMLIVFSGLLLSAVITERTQAEDSLREQKEQLAKTTHELNFILENAPLGITRIVDRKQIMVNRMMENIFQYSKEEMEFQTTRMLYPSDEAYEKLGNEAYPALAQGIVYETERELIKKDGTSILARYIGKALDPKDMSKGTIWLLEDVTERRQAQAALRESEERFRAITENTPDHIVIHDRQLKYLFVVNPQLGLTKQEMLGKTDYDFLPKEEAERLVQAKNRVMESGKPMHFETALTSRNGETEYFDGTYIPKFDTQGQVDGLIGYFRNVTGRKQAEEQLRESEERYQRITEAITDYVYTVRVAEGRVVDTTHGTGCFVVTGYEADEFTHEPYLWLNMVVDKDRPMVEEQARRILAGEDFPPIEHRIVHKNGTVRWVKNTFVPRRDEHGILISYDGLIQDITERKQAEKALRLNEARLEGLWNLYQSSALTVPQIADFVLEEQIQLTNSFLGFLIFLNEDETVGTIHAWSKATMAECGVTEKPPQFVIAESGLWGESVRQRQPLVINDYAAPHPAKKGFPAGHVQIKRYLSVPVFDNDRIVAVAAVANKSEEYDQSDVRQLQLLMDGMWSIIQRKQTEEALLEREATLHAWMEAMQESVFLMDKNGIVLTANTTTARRLNCLVEDLIGASIFDFIPPEIAESRRLQILKVLQTRLPVNFQDTRFGRTIENFIYPIFDEAGQVKSLAILGTDITERKQAEDEIRQLNTTLEQRVEERTQELRDAQEKLLRQEKLSVLGQMAGSVGHELRNPLGVISNALYFLKLIQPDADEKVKEYLDMIQKQVHISDKIVGDLLDFTRIKSLDLESISISNLIQQTLERFPAPENIQVEIDIPADLPQAYADPQHLIQILGNLTLNACQAMKDGGQLVISSRAQDKMICIAVKDTGSGIPPENMKKLFEPLFTTKPKGIGLGLAVCKKLIEANGGKIEVESAVGVGSTFTVWLPIQK